MNLAYVSTPLFIFDFRTSKLIRNGVPVFTQSIYNLILQNIHGDCSKNTDFKELEEWKKYKKIIPYFLEYYIV